MNHERLVLINGEIVPESRATVSIFDIGRLYGAAFYESIRTFRHTLFRLSEHYARLKASLRYAGILDMLDFNRVEEAVIKTLKANIDLTHKDDDMWICVEVTPGTGFPMPLKKGNKSTPTIFAYSSELPHADYVRYYAEGKPVVTSIFRNIPSQSFEQRCKNRARLPHYLSKLYCQGIDSDAFALMLDTDGFLTEGTGANIFFVSNGKLITPTSRNILNGISRLYTIELAKNTGIEVIEKDIGLYEAYNAEEAFWTTTSYCILPIRSIDGRSIGGGKPGKTTLSLISAWSASVGVDIIGQAKRFSC